MEGTPGRLHRAQLLPPAELVYTLELSTAMKEVAEVAATAVKEKAAPLAGGVTALQDPPALRESSSLPALSAARKVTALALARPAKLLPAEPLPWLQLWPPSAESSTSPVLEPATEALHMEEGEPEMEGETLAEADAEEKTVMRRLPAVTDTELLTLAVTVAL